ncbi:EamA family transporter [uncultured Umboniibacter sp.]|uniref:DMT family transporter n=1 Tax=uncultured Umboniibacter sp. TaxID=1798917 RepID=UPI00260AD6AA|nr:EamA family transporter [uncultured Umboniibacter sp.]
MNSIALFIIASLIWGTTWIAITFQLGDVAPEASVSYRFAIASIGMLIIAKWQRVDIRVSWRAQLWMALLGLFYTINYISVYRAEAEISSGLVAVAGSGILFFNIVLSRVLFGYLITRQLAIGSLLGLAGIAVLFAPDLIAFEPRYAIGVSFAIVAALAASSANMVAVKNGNAGHSIITTNVWWMIWCTVFTALAVPLTGNSFSFSWEPSYLASLFYLAIFGSIVAFTSYLSLMKNVGPSKAGYIAVITPVLALLISTVFEDLVWKSTDYLGVLLIIIGQVVIFKRKAVTPLSDDEPHDDNNKRS